MQRQCNANPQHKQVEYRSRWVPNANSCVGYVLSFFCVHFICVGSRFSVEYGCKGPTRTILVLSVCYSEAININVISQQSTSSQCKYFSIS